MQENLCGYINVFSSLSAFCKVIRSFYSLSHLSTHLRIHSLNIQNKPSLPWHLPFCKITKKVFFITQLFDTITQLVLLWKILRLQQFHFFLSDSDSSKTAVQSDISAYSRKFSVKNYSNLLQNSKSNQNDSFHEQKLKQICKETKTKSL